jgi:aminoglycoside phosphotransferase family enzyme/predicted kinase
MNAEWIERLRDPAAFPERPDRVEIRQTHLSLVCLAGDAAYKLKKPIRLPFADFSTLELRERFCHEELRLNRRLCPEVYLSVEPLRRLADGRLSFCPGEEGEIVDHAVKMRRLPEERMLDRVLEEGAVTESEIRAIARRVAAFHAQAGRGESVAELGSPERVRGFALANFAETRELAGTVFPAALHEALAGRAQRDFDRWMPELHRRALEGHVVDGHGDLHARNICLTEPPSIFDCIEFCPSFRCGDVATEHAFLAMDLRFRGHPELAAAYLDEVMLATGDTGMREVLPVLFRYRAMVRAKVSAIAAGESDFSETARAEAADTARRYLRLAAASAIEEDGPLWLMFCGLPGSGKSSVADCLSRASGGAWPIFSTDRIRKELAGVPPTDPLPPAFYTPEFSRRTYDELRRRALAASGPGKVVILDANFRERAERALTAESASKAGARLAILALQTSEDTIVSRLDHRATVPGTISDADRAVFRSLRDQFEPPNAAEAGRLIAVPGDAAAEFAAADIFAALLD